MVALLRERFDYNPFHGVGEADEIDQLEGMLDLSGNVPDKYYLPLDNKYGKLIFEAGAKLPDNCLVQLRQSILRPQPKGMCPTLTANMGRGGHNVPFVLDKGRLRRLTERECQVLQGFPLNFDFGDILGKDIYTLIGNSVSPRVSVKIGHVLRQVFEELTP